MFAACLRNKMVVFYVQLEVFPNLQLYVQLPEIRNFNKARNLALVT